MINTSRAFLKFYLWLAKIYKTLATIFKTDESDMIAFADILIFLHWLSKCSFYRLENAQLLL